MSNRSSNGADQRLWNKWACQHKVKWFMIGEMHCITRNTKTKRKRRQLVGGRR